MCQVAHSIRSGGAAVLAQSHFLEMEVKFTSRSVLEGTSSGGARRDTAVAANGSVPSLRPSFHPSRPAGCNSGPLPPQPLRDSPPQLRHRREPRFVEGVKKERRERGGGHQETARGQEGENSLTSSGVASEELFRRGIITPLMTARARREEGTFAFGGFSPVFCELSLRRSGFS